MLVNSAYMLVATSPFLILIYICALAIICFDIISKSNNKPKTEDNLYAVRDKLLRLQDNLESNGSIELAGEDGTLKRKLLTWEGIYPVIKKIVLSDHDVKVFTMDPNRDLVVRPLDNKKFKCGILPTTTMGYHFVFIGRDKYRMFFPPEQSSELLTFLSFINAKAKGVNIGELSVDEIKKLLKILH